MYAAFAACVWLVEPDEDRPTIAGA